MSFEKMLASFEGGAYRPESFETYYEQSERLDALGISIPPEARVLEMQAPFAKMAIDVLTEVLIPAGFIIADDGRKDLVRDLRVVWQANDMDSQFNLAAAEALAAGSVFWVLSPADEDHEHPSVRALDSRHAGVRIDHFGNVIEGIAVYRTGDGVKCASYYTPDGMTAYRQVGTRWVSDWSTSDPWGASIVPMFNRARLRDRYGRSDLKELKTVIDAASRTLTNLQMGQEVAAFPLRFLIGDGADRMLAGQQAAAAMNGQFGGNRMENYAGALLAAPTGADVKQLTGASLDTFTNTYRTYALQISAMTGIPPSMMGVAADNNPTSAEALRVAKDRLIARAENKQRQFSDALERIARIIAVMNGESPEGLETLEVMWADAAAPSASAQMATAMQAESQGVIGAETARDFMHLSPEQMERENRRQNDLDSMAGQILPIGPQEEDDEDPEGDGEEEDPAGDKDEAKK